MDPNNPGYPLHPQPPYPVTSQSPSGQPFPYYPNAMPSFPQQKTPAHLPHQQQQSLGLPLQPGPGGAVMPAGFPQPSSGMSDRSIVSPALCFAFLSCNFFFRDSADISPWIVLVECLFPFLVSFIAS